MAAPPFDTEATLQACAAGDQEALKALYQREAARMLALASRMLGHRDDAEDAVRDTFILVWKNAGSYDPAAGPARAWIYSILRYRVLRQIRQRTADVAGTKAAGPELAGYLTLPSKCLAQLDDTQRLPLLLAFYHGLDLNQIATRLMSPAEQIRAQLRSGLDALQGQHA